MTSSWFRHAFVILASGLLAAIAAAACRSQPPASVPAAPPFRTTSSVREIMHSVVAPSAQGLWESVGTISNASGTVHLAPKTDEDWARVRRHAVTLVESTTLLMIPGRRIAQAGASALKAEEADPGAELDPAEIEKRVAVDWQAWTGMALALHDAATAVLKTVDARDVAGLETTGSDLDGACETCHLTFWYPPKRRTGG